MSEAKFTKGKWVIISDENSVEIAELEKNWHICNMNGRCDNSMHDANLIAAAPDMYEFIKRLVEPFTNVESMLCEVDSLLAKARGEL